MPPLGPTYHRFAHWPVGEPGQKNSPGAHEPDPKRSLGRSVTERESFRAPSG